MKNLYVNEKEKSAAEGPEPNVARVVRSAGEPVALAPEAAWPVARSAASSVAPESNSVGPGSRVWRGVEVLWRVVSRLADGGQMVRLVGPNERPEERHEFEKPKLYEWRHY